jgi:hypothetical protein
MKTLLLILICMGSLLVIWFIIRVILGLLEALAGGILLGSENMTEWMLHYRGDIILKILSFPFWIILGITAKLIELLQLVLIGLTAWMAADMVRDWWWKGRK